MRNPADDPLIPPQVIPRPPTAHPGAPASWEGLDPAARTGLSLEVVRAGLAAAGRSGDATLREAGGDHGEHIVASAVLVALFEEAGEARVVLTRRSAALRLHRGEVSFPGGRIEPGESIADAALREAAEEVALDPGLVEPAGWLHPVATIGSRSLIQPVIGTLEARPVLVASPREVARVFDVALAELAADGVFHEERWQVSGLHVPGSPDGSFPVWFFAAAGEIVWGATARILVDLLRTVLGV